MTIAAASLAAWLVVAGTSSSVAQTPAGAVPAVCRVTLNGIDLGDAIGLVEGPDIWIPVALLERAGLRWQSADTRIASGETLVSLRSIAPRLTYTFDRQEVRVAIDAPAEAFGEQVVGLRQPAAPDRTGSPAVFLNYAATMRGGVDPRYALEAGATVGRAFISTTASTTGPGAWVRGASAVIVDDLHRLVRWQMGDTTAHSTFSGAVPVVGLTVGREFGLNPEALRYVPVGVSGTTAVPAVAEVYVNNQLVGRTDVEPGAFTIRDVPVPAGAGDVRLAVRDAFGRVTEMSSGFYRTPRLVVPGEHEFRYTIGSPRDETGASRYAGFAAAVEHRVGATRWLTLGASAWGHAATAAAGGEVVVATPAGEIGFKGESGRGPQGGIGLWSLSYAYLSRRFSVHASMFDADLRREAIASVSLVLPRSITTTFSHIDSRAGQVARTQSAVSFGFSLPARASLSATVLHERRGATSGVRALSAVTLPLGARTSASVVHNADVDTRPRTTAVLQRNVPLGPGLGYRLETHAGRSPAHTALVELQGSVARVELRREASGAGAHQSATIAGAISFLDGALHLSRPIADAFAIVRVGQIAGVPAFVSNQYVGRTGRGGTLLVPSLVSHAANRLSVSDTSLPLTVSLKQTERLVAPGVRGAVVVRFDVDEVNLLGGQFVAERADADTPGLAPAAQTGIDEGAVAEVAWPAALERVVLGAGGSFLLEQAVPGRHRVSIRTSDRWYACALEVPDARGRPTGALDIRSVGRVSCARVTPPPQGGGR